MMRGWRGIFLRKRVWVVVEVDYLDAIAVHVRDSFEASVGNRVYYPETRARLHVRLSSLLLARRPNLCIASILRGITFAFARLCIVKLSGECSLYFIPVYVSVVA